MQNTPNITVGTIGSGNITSTGQISGTQLDVTGTVSDAGGNLRSVINDGKASQHALVVGDRGKLINSTSGGWVINQNLGFVAGDCFTLYNSSGSDMTLTAGTNVTIRKVGSSDSGNRTVAERGLVTVVCVSSNEWVATGGGLS